MKKDILKQIKEFFEYDSGIVCDEKVAYFKEDTFNKLLDYKTNLQEQLIEYQKALDETTSEKIDLQEENKIQKEKIEHLLIDLRGESEYKQRIDKAIEYIKQNSKCGGSFINDKFVIEYIDEIFNGMELLNILNGDDKYE